MLRDRTERDTLQDRTKALRQNGNTESACCGGQVSRTASDSCDKSLRCAGRWRRLRSRVSGVDAVSTRPSFHSVSASHRHSVAASQHHSGVGVFNQWDLVCNSCVEFPALTRTEAGLPIAYFDGPAGSQVPQSVIDAVGEYLGAHNANRGACFGSSQETDSLIAAAHRAHADFVGATDPGEISFGANMTTITLGLSRAMVAPGRRGMD